MTRGTLYGVSVGPGDPELITLKALRMLQEADCIAVPNIGHGRQTALRIIEGHIEGKRLIDCPTPMTRKHEEALRSYEQIATAICAELDEGRSVAYAVIGDATIYSTYMYVHEIVEARGYPVQIIPGESSLCSVAARAGKALCKGPEQLLVVPTLHGDVSAALDVPGVKAFMKAGHALPELKRELAERGLLDSSFAVANCGLEDEAVFSSLHDLDECKDYFVVVVVRDGEAPAGGAVPAEGNATQPFFTNSSCPHFPCHEGIDDASFNCLFCYCPLYALGPDCGGNFRYTASGVKSCKECPIPHTGTDGLKLVKEKFKLLSDLAAAKE